MSTARMVGRGLALPGLLYLQPERFGREFDRLVPVDTSMSVVGALRVARRDRAVRGAMLEMLGAGAVASFGWACALCGLLDLVGVPIYWVGAAAGLVGGVAGGGALGAVFGYSAAVACGVAGAIAGGVADGVAGGVVIANDVVALGLNLATLIEVHVGIAGQVAGGAVVGTFFGGAVLFTVGADDEFVFGPMGGPCTHYFSGWASGSFSGSLSGSLPGSLG